MVLRSNNSDSTEEFSMLFWYFSISFKNGVICQRCRMVDMCVSVSLGICVWVFGWDKSQHVFSSWYVWVCMHCTPLRLNAYVLIYVCTCVYVFKEAFHKKKPLISNVYSLGCACNLPGVSYSPSNLRRIITPSAYTVFRPTHTSQNRLESTKQ